tara:strand:- start:13998 stop:14366 length:369 start_codon:yes stop_codon:yes gene_type:complete
MEFFINKNSTLPKLKMELVNDGRNNFREFYEKVQNAVIKFTMYDVETNVKKIANSKASIQLKDPNCSIGGDKPEYYIVYKFTSTDTKKVGRYQGQFTITFLDGTGTLIAPIRDELFINVLDN